MLASMLIGCSKNTNARSFGSVCEFHLEGLPKEYDQLAEEIRGDIEISVTLRNVSSNKKHNVKLTDANGYSQSLDLIPGTYDVNKPYISKKYLTMFDVEIKINTITIAKDSRTEIPIYVSNSSEFVSVMNNNQAKDEILNADIYSRKAQYNGKIVDLYNIRKVIKFTTPEANKTLAPAETLNIPSSNNEGISLMMKNQSNIYVPVNKATFTGIRFSSNNVILPKGITLGSTLHDISHAKDGILGTPDYCLGTPLMGMDFDSTTLVYIDKNSGDRISFYFSPDNLYVSSITYEFAKFE